jgi:hypothetical protein
MRGFFCFLGGRFGTSGSFFGSSPGSEGDIFSLFTRCFSFFRSFFGLANGFRNLFFSFCRFLAGLFRRLYRSFSNFLGPCGGGGGCCGRFFGSLFSCGSGFAAGFLCCCSSFFRSLGSESGGFARGTGGFFSLPDIDFHFIQDLR